MQSIDKEKLQYYWQLTRLGLMTEENDIFRAILLQFFSHFGVMYCSNNNKTTLTNFMSSCDSQELDEYFKMTCLDFDGLCPSQKTQAKDIIHIIQQLKHEKLPLSEPMCDVLNGVACRRLINSYLRGCSNIHYELPYCIKQSLDTQTMQNLACRILDLEYKELSKAFKASSYHWFRHTLVCCWMLYFLNDQLSVSLCSVKQMAQTVLTIVAGFRAAQTALFGHSLRKHKIYQPINGCNVFLFDYDSFCILLQNILGHVFLLRRNKPRGGVNCFQSFDDFTGNIGHEMCSFNAKEFRLSRMQTSETEPMFYAAADGQHKLAWYDSYDIYHLKVVEETLQTQFAATLFDTVQPSQRNIADLKKILRQLYVELPCRFALEDFTTKIERKMANQCEEKEQTDPKVSFDIFAYMKKTDPKGISFSTLSHI